MIVVLYFSKHRGVMFDQMSVNKGISIITSLSCEFLDKLDKLVKLFI